MGKVIAEEGRADVLAACEGRAAAKHVEHKEKSHGSQSKSFTPLGMSAAQLSHSNMTSAFILFKKWFAGHVGEGEDLSFLGVMAAIDEAVVIAALAEAALGEKNEVVVEALDVVFVPVRAVLAEGEHAEVALGEKIRRCG